MSTIVWKDCTSYSRHGDRTPHWWETKLGKMRLSVGNSHIDFGVGTWLMKCSPWFETAILSAKTESEAKQEALDKVERELVAALAAIRGERGGHLDDV
jgi:hypothetical protein